MIMRRFLAPSAVLLSIFLPAAASRLPAATVRLVPFEILIERSEHVVYGRVVGIRSLWDEETRTIWTQTELQVLDAPKGAAPRSVIITEPGGEMGNVGHLVPGIPSFSLNEEVVVFLYEAERNRLRVTGLRQGVYAVERDPETGDRIVQAQVPRPESVFVDRPGRVTRQSLARESNRLDDFLYRIRKGAR
jgi:hypothetical protein